APRIARFVEHGVGQHVVQEELLGHRGGPRELRACREGEVEVRLQESERELAVFLGHVLDEETRRALAGVAVGAASLRNERLERVRVRSRATEAEEECDEHGNPWMRAST